jgi:hypothetical protein
MFLFPAVNNAKRKGTFLKPSMFFSIPAKAENPDLAAKVFNFFLNDLGANDILLAERGVPFLGPLLYLNRPRSFTVSLALRMFADPMSSTDWGAIFAMGTLSLIPVLAIFVVFQKYIVEGLVTSGLKA